MDDFPMVTTLMSKSKLKTFGFANTLSKTTSFLANIEKALVIGSGDVEKTTTTISIKRPREDNENENNKSLLNINKKSRVEKSDGKSPAPRAPVEEEKTQQPTFRSKQ